MNVERIRGNVVYWSFLIQDTIEHINRDKEFNIVFDQDYHSLWIESRKTGTVIKQIKFTEYRSFLEMKVKALNYIRLGGE